MAVTREAFNRELIELVTRLARSHKRATETWTDIDVSTPLFETGLIDSLGILELLAFVEERTGNSIPVQKVDLRFFGTVDRISRSFWRDAKEPAHEPTVSAVGARQNRA